MSEQENPEVIIEAGKEEPLDPRRKVKIVNEELGLESEIIASSLTAWELRGWTLVDDSK